MVCDGSLVDAEPFSESCERGTLLVGLDELKDLARDQPAEAATRGARCGGLWSPASCLVKRSFQA